MTDQELSAGITPRYLQKLQAIITHGPMKTGQLAQTIGARKKGVYDDLLDMRRLGLVSEYWRHDDRYWTVERQVRAIVETWPHDIRGHRGGFAHEQADA